MTKTKVIFNVPEEPPKDEFMPFQPIDTAPQDGTEVVGWIPYFGHDLIQWKDDCWQSLKRTELKHGLFHYELQPLDLNRQPTHWRPKQPGNTHWFW